MGMFDEIDVELPCRNCGQPITGFQSKDGPCDLVHLTPQQLFDIAGSGATFYTRCSHCKTWNEWTFAPPAAIKIIPYAPGESAS